jgi:non-heme chloroperoxidase
MALEPTRLPLSTQVTLSLVDVGDRRSDDVLVLLPGLSDSWRSYELVLPHLPSSIRTVAVSQRGHGESDKPESHYGVRDFATDLDALLDALGARRAVIAGHSSASTVARRFALDHPERVAGLVIEGSFLSLDRRAASSVQARLLALTDPIPRAFAEEFAVGTFVRPPPTSFVHRMVDESLRAPARVWRETFASLVDYDDARELESLGAPALILWGNQDAIIDREAVEALARAIRSSTLIVYGNVGHTPHWEDPERFARDVTAFVEQCRRQ